MTEETKKNGLVESPKQREAFLIYFKLEGERSLQVLRQKLAEKDIKISLTSLKKWSSKFNWQDRIAVMDQEVTDKSEEIAIKEATAKKSDILKAVKNTMIVYNRELLSGGIIPNASDFKKMWEIMRVELGKTTGAEPEPAPAINIFLTKNEKVINIVKKAEKELYELLSNEIKE